MVRLLKDGNRAFTGDPNCDTGIKSEADEPSAAFFMEEIRW